MKYWSRFLFYYAIAELLWAALFWASPLTRLSVQNPDKTPQPGKGPLVFDGGPVMFPSIMLAISLFTEGLKNLPVLLVFVGTNSVFAAIWAAR